MKGLPFVQNKRKLTEAARAELAKRVRGSSVGKVAAKARSAEHTIQTAISGGPLMERTCAKLEAFVQRAP